MLQIATGTVLAELVETSVKYAITPVNIGLQARGLGELQPPLSPAKKPLFFGQKLNFSGRSKQPKMKKNLH